jgi:PadR family transcriptional regulator
MPVGEFEQIVMLSLFRIGKDAYGVSIWREIVDRTGRDVSLGAVYKTLERLEDKGLVGSRQGAPTPERGGRRKKHYRLLAAGHRALTQSLAALRSMTDGLDAELKL